MARKKSRNRSSERDALDIARHSLPHVALRPSRPFHLSTFEDRRTYYPEPGLRPALTFTGAEFSVGAAPRTRAQARRQPSSANLLSTISRFRNAPDVVICAKRKVRRQSLFALGKIRSGAGRLRRPRRSTFTGVTCR